MSQPLNQRPRTILKSRGNLEAQHLHQTDCFQDGLACTGTDGFELSCCNWQLRSTHQLCVALSMLCTFSERIKWGLYESLTSCASKHNMVEHPRWGVLFGISFRRSCGVWWLLGSQGIFTTITIKRGTLIAISIRSCSIGGSSMSRRLSMGGWSRVTGIAEHSLSNERMLKGGQFVEACVCT